MPRKSSFIMMIALSFVLIGIILIKPIVLAGQSGSSPESGAVSRIKTIYDSLISLDHGTHDAGPWGNWGSMWNRIRSSAEWVPSGDADETDVASGKTFYKDSRTQKTGTAMLPLDYSQQSLVKFDNYVLDDETGEESAWINTAANVWKDNRTGLYWSNKLGTYTNMFTISSCDFYTTTPRGNYTGGDTDCGDAINACGVLSLEAITGAGEKNEWYLPSQDELMQAYIDGMYNQTSGDFTGWGGFWSSTQSYDGLAYIIYLANGWTGKTQMDYLGDDSSVRCVRRD